MDTIARLGGVRKPKLANSSREQRRRVGAPDGHAQNAAQQRAVRPRAHGTVLQEQGGRLALRVAAAAAVQRTQVQRQIAASAQQGQSDGG
jgi:hypothetical protein